MAVGLQSAAEGQVVNTTFTSATITPTGTDRAIIAAVAYKSNSVLTETSIIYAGSENLNIVRRNIDGGDAQVSLWELPAPVAASGTVVLIMPSSIKMGVVIYVFTGVDQSNPVEVASVAEAQGVDTNPSVGLTNPSGQIGIDIMAQVSAGADTIDANSGTIRMNQNITSGGSDCRAGSQSDTAVNPTMNYTISDIDNWNIMAVSLQPPAPVTGQPAYLRDENSIPDTVAGLMQSKPYDDDRKYIKHGSGLLIPDKKIIIPVGIDLPKYRSM